MCSLQSQHNMQYQNLGKKTPKKNLFWLLSCPLDVSKVKHQNRVVQIHNTELKHAQSVNPTRGHVIIHTLTGNKQLKYIIQKHKIPKTKQIWESSSAINRPI